MDELQAIEGTVESVIYKNEENGYAVFSVFADGEETVCVGNVVGLTEGEGVKITGVYVVHPFYGKQLSVKSYERVMPDTEQGIERYLGSGIIKGVGMGLAARIVKRFGKETFNVIEQEPLRLADVKGISEKKAAAIAEEYIKQIELKNVMLFLQEFGLTTAAAIKIYLRYKAETFDVINTNPYRIADDITGIGFKTADALAERAGVAKDSIYRIKSGIKYTLNRFAANGHTFAPFEDLCRDCAELLDIDGLPFSAALTEMQLEGQIVRKTVSEIDAVYLSWYYAAESNSAKKLALLSANVEGAVAARDTEIAAFERESGIGLAGKQKEAVREALGRGVLVITGGPGTGKTTIIKALLAIYDKDGKETVLTAPTGRAAKRITEATGRPAQTIHRLLESGYSEGEGGKFGRNEETPLECDVVIVDEASMVDVLLLNSLLRAIPLGTRLILVGDANQLPSVGAGNVLADIIESGCVAVVALDTVFRQARKSAIVMNAHRINSGEQPVFNEDGTDFFFIGRGTAEGVAETVLSLLSERLPGYINAAETEIQVLTPMRKGPLGVIELNKLLQARLNPPSPDKNERELRAGIFREGDKVMQIKNNYDVSWVVADGRGQALDEGAGVFNGDQGKIEKIGDSFITVLFDDGKTVEYDMSNLDELELAYAVTVHKSQGSEYAAVVMPVLAGPYMLLTRNLLYTAVTRARRLVALVGSQDKIYDMVRNNMEVRRYSGLKEQLVKAFSLLM